MPTIQTCRGSIPATAAPAQRTSAKQRGRLAHCALAAVLLGLAGGAGAQAWPSKTITMIIPFPPGGTLDTVGRTLAQKLGEQLGQSVIIDNRAGAGGAIGSAAVARATPDGYTLLFAPSTFTTTPMVVKTTPYSVTKDFQPVALVAKAPLSVAVNKNLPVTDIKGLIAHAKSNPGKLTFAIGSSGSAGHLSTELLKRATGIDYMIVPYKGSGPAYQDLIGGQIDGFVDPVLGSAQYAKGGMLKVLAVTSKARIASMPNVPTVAETVPGYEFYSWYGVWAPAKLPQEIAQRLNAEVNKALNGPDMKEKFTAQGLLLTPGSIADFTAFQKEDMERSAKIISEANIRAE